MLDRVNGQTADVIVLGAGIVGVSAAYAARQRGLSVILIDRREPGSETSYGNAGVLSSGSILPLNKPSLWKALPSYMTNRNAALRWDPAWAFRNIDWVVRFLANATAAQSQAAGDSPARADRRILKTASGMDRQSGCGAAHPRDRLAEGVAQRRRRCGEGRAGLSGRIWHRKPAARPPGHFRARAEHLAGLQGWPVAHRRRLRSTRRATWSRPMRGCLRAPVARSASRTSRRSLPDGEGWRVVLADGGISARHVVVALGPWSADLLRPLGYRVPLAFERGYHREFKPNPARSLQRPIHDAEGKFSDDADGAGHPRHQRGRTDRP